MFRSILRLGFVPVVAAGAALVVGYAALHTDDVDRKAYVQRNLALLARVPPFPASRRFAVYSTPYRLEREPFHRSYVAGYSTTATYQAPRRTSASDVIRFYGASLRGWRLASWESRGGRERSGVPRARRRCYARGNESICIDLTEFVVRGTVRNARRFTVAVDHRLYVPRPG